MSFERGQSVYMRCRVVDVDRDGRVIVEPLDEKRQAKDGAWFFCPEHALVKVADILKAVRK